MSLVSIYTVGRLNHPIEHPASREFFEVGNNVFGQAIKSGHLVQAFSSDGVPFPQEAIKGKGFPVLTLTVWKDLESLYLFTYSGLHRQALRERNKWIEPYQEKHLSYVIWWTEKLKDVSWKEAFMRYNYYTQNGATSFAFDFKHSFDDKGEPFLVK
ncbi:DUF3291 domain-containing protein [Psychrobacillus sp. FJAT-51614]|uniref:DUF3291 domain-containing protein n=1 Tax=Psychrobacillus mangrovi TaxID=3117745 RepID=A0ABU8F987_9BACI